MQYDVIVVGGGAAGVGASVGARLAGARTLLVESGPCLGGAATQKNVMTYCGLWTQADPTQQAVFGVAERVLQHLRHLGGVEEQVRLPAPSCHVIALIDPEAVKLSLDRVCLDIGVEVLFGTLLTAATRSRDRITSITLQDDCGPREVSAAAFVDASGEGDLAAFGGASVRYGNHGTAQAGTLGVRFGGVSPDADISGKRWTQAIREARSRGELLLDKEEGLVVKLPISGDLATYYIDAVYDALDGTSMSQAERAGREKAWAYLQAIKTIPGYGKAYIVSTGPKFGTRESRHVNSQYQVTEDDVTGGARFEDAVALGAWPMEYHPGGGRPTVWKDIRNKGTFDIPLRTLMSRDTPNLLTAGRLVDGGGGGAMRVMGTSFATGHAAGAAAALLASSGAIDAQTVRKQLVGQGACLAL